MDSIMDIFTARQMNEEYIIILSTWEDKINAAYFIFITIIIDRLQTPIRQMIDLINAWNCLRDLYISIDLQHRFTLSWQLYSLHKKSIISI